jgi:outer membrane protein assembly factor BamA
MSLQRALPMSPARSFLALLLLLIGAPVFAQALADDPDPAPQRQTTIPMPPTTPDGNFGIFKEPSFITRGINLFDRRANRSRQPKNGFYVEWGNMITGAGWLSAGPGYRHYLFGDNAVVSASGAASVRLYQVAQANIDFPHLAADHIRLGAQSLYRDAVQVNYFGLGNDSLESNRSGYRLKSNDVSAYGVFSARALAVRLRAGWLRPVSVLPMSGDQFYPSTTSIFSAAQAPGLFDQPTAFFHGDLGFSIDTRDSIGHPTAGGFYQATWSTYQDQETGHYSFQRYEADATHYMPLGSDNWILALHGGAALSTTHAGHEVPFYLMPNLGGRNLRGYADYRFHDRNMQTYGAELRWRIFAHVDAAAFADAGSVASTIQRLKFSDVKPSVGVGVRLHDYKFTMARLDFGHGAEGWHIYFKMNEPFRLTTQANGWRTVIPFVP